MERWAIIVMGTLFGLPLIFAVFYFCEKMQKWRVRRASWSASIPMRAPAAAATSSSPHGTKAETSPLVYEEFDSPQHECVVVVVENGQKIAGICAFLQELQVEYFVTPFPACCSIHPQESAFRAAVAAISHWAPKWAYAEAVNFLSTSGALVRQVNRPTTRQCRLIKQFEGLHEFPLFFQWTENFMCDFVANQELWETLVRTCRRLLSSASVVGGDAAAANAADDHVWNDFPLEHWLRKRVNIDGEHFHHVAHPGQVTPDNPAAEEGETVNERQAAAEIAEAELITTFLR